MRSPSKSERHEAILHTIARHEIATQEQLVRALTDAGFAVTQTTVSRDIRELGLVKVPGDSGPRYAPARDDASMSPSARAVQAFRRYVTDVAFSGYMLVVKTIPGSAPLVAATLDELQLDDVAGTVAGDDAVLVIVKDGRHEPLPGPPSYLYDLFTAWREEE